MSYTRPAPTRSYSYKGLHPYGAGDLFAMDNYVDPDFSGNVPEEIMQHNGGRWDEARKVMTMPSGIEVYFVES